MELYLVLQFRLTEHPKGGLFIRKGVDAPTKLKVGEDQV